MGGPPRSYTARHDLIAYKLEHYCPISAMLPANTTPTIGPSGNSFDSSFWCSRGDRETGAIAANCLLGVMPQAPERSWKNCRCDTSRAGGAACATRAPARTHLGRRYADGTQALTAEVVGVARLAFGRALPREWG